MRRATYTALLAFALAMLVVLVAGAAPAPFVVVVNPENPQTALERRFLADAFLKKATRWPSGAAIRPVDQKAQAPVREAFSASVLRRSVAAVKSYWQQMIFAGRETPPPELEGDEEVIRYVAKTPGAVGYVSGAATLAGTRAVSVTD